MKQTSLIVESNGSGKDKLDALLKEGYKVVSVTANHGKSYNDFLIILEKEEDSFPSAWRSLPIVPVHPSLPLFSSPLNSAGDNPREKGLHPCPAVCYATRPVTFIR